MAHLCREPKGCWYALRLGRRCVELAQRPSRGPKAVSASVSLAAARRK